MRQLLVLCLGAMSATSASAFEDKPPVAPTPQPPGALIELFAKEGEHQAIESIAKARVYVAYRWQGAPLRGYILLRGGKEPNRLDLGEETVKLAREVWKSQQDPKAKDAPAFDPAKVQGKLLVVLYKPEKGKQEFKLILEVGYKVRPDGVLGLTKEYTVTNPWDDNFMVGARSEIGEKRRWVKSMTEGKVQEDFLDFGLAKPGEKK